ncbi:MAG: hypothetical protein R2865_08735 [Deinococcales bacterium]
MPLKVAQTGGLYQSHGIDFQAIEAMEHLQHDETTPIKTACTALILTASSLNIWALW